ncbi:unnamed protein product, partial [Staurois parvus]
MLLKLVISGKNVPYIGASVGRMFLTLVVSGKNAHLTLGVSGKNVPYIGGQWEECPLHWGSVGRMSLTLGCQ